MPSYNWKNQQEAFTYLDAVVAIRMCTAPRAISSSGTWRLLMASCSNRPHWILRI